MSLDSVRPEVDIVFLVGGGALVLDILSLDSFPDRDPVMDPATDPVGEGDRGLEVIYYNLVSVLKKVVKVL